MGRGIVTGLAEFHLSNDSWGPADAANHHAEPGKASSVEGAQYYGGYLVSGDESFIQD